MKLILSISIIFFTCNIYAQKTVTFEEADSLSNLGKIVMAKYDSVTHKIYYQVPTPDTIYTLRPLIEKYDTSLVLMLMCDTSAENGTVLNGNGIVFWQIGWEVRSGGAVISYLNFDKQEFQKSIIIWQTKSFYDYRN